LGDFVLEELGDVRPLIAKASARDLPVVEMLEDYEQELTAIEREDVQKRVARLAQEGAALKKRRDEVGRIGVAMSPENLERIFAAQAVLTNVWPVMQRVDASANLDSTVSELRDLLAEPEVFSKMHEVKVKSDAIHRAFASSFEAAHSKRNEANNYALDRVRGDERLQSATQAAVRVVPRSNSSSLTSRP